MGGVDHVHGELSRPWRCTRSRVFTKCSLRAPAVFDAFVWKGHASAAGVAIIKRLKLERVKFGSKSTINARFENRVYQVHPPKHLDGQLF